MKYSYLWFAKLTFSACIGFGLSAHAEMDFFYVHTDHINTPRQLINEAGAIVWTGESAPFGESMVEEDPDGDGKLVKFNMRFPGQYLDSATGLHYNYFRDYDSSLGRYIQSDPIGLNGGINTYAYVGGNPVSNVDPLGLSRLTIGGSGGTGTDIDNPSGQGLIDALAGYSDGSVEKMRLTGHGDRFSQCISPGRSCSDYIDNNLDVWSDGRLLGNLEDLLRRKLSPGADLELAGCNNASGDKNLAKAASRALPGIPVTGGLGYQLGYENNPLFGNSDGSLGLKRTYVNGALQ